MLLSAARAAVTATLLYLLAVHSLAKPIVERISGCLGSGPSTSYCLTGNTITLHGRNFTDQLRDSPIFYLDVTPYQNVTRGSSDLWTSTVTVLDDSTATVAWLVQINIWRPLIRYVFDYGRRPVPIWLHEQPEHNVSISFADFSPAEVDSITGCERVDGAFNRTRCLPGTSTLLLRGSWLANPTAVEVGPFSDGSWLPCKPITYDDFSSNVWGVLLPGMPLAVENGSYSIRVSRPNTPAIVWPEPFYVVAGQPIISSFAPCWDSAQPWWGYNTQDYLQLYPTKCQPGQLLTILGNFFRKPDPSFTPTVRFSLNVRGEWFVCVNVTVVNSTAVTCVLPPAPHSNFDASYFWELTLGPGYAFQSTWITPYDWPDAPRIRSAQCVSKQPSALGESGLVVDGCRGGGVLSMTVYWLDGSVPKVNASQLQVVEAVYNRMGRIATFRDVFLCTNPSIAVTATDMQLNCTMPAAYQLDLLLPFQPSIAFTIHQSVPNSKTIKTSNAVYVTLYNSTGAGSTPETCCDEGDESSGEVLGLSDTVPVAAGMGLAARSGGCPAVSDRDALSPREVCRAGTGARCQVLSSQSVNRETAENMLTRGRGDRGADEE